MKNIVIVDKSTGAATEQTFGNIALKETSIVKLPISQASIQSMQQSGKNLVVTLKSGETVTIQNFFVVGEDGAANQLVLENDDGTLLLGSYSTPYSGFTFSELGSLEDLALAAQAGAGVPDWLVWGLSLLGAGAAIAALSHGGGGGGGGGDGGNGITSDTTAPNAPTNLSVAADGLTVFGKGEANTTVTVKDAAGNTIGTGHVGADGNFAVNLDHPQVNGETLDVTLTDAAGNVSVPTQVDAGDTTAPDAPTELAVSADGTTVSGKGEPNTTVTIKDANGNTIGTGQVGADGNFAIQLDHPRENGETLGVTLTDAAGNVSSPSQVIAGDTTAPDAPTNLAVSHDGITVSGKGEANTDVTIRDADGNSIGTGHVDNFGNFSIELATPRVNGETLGVTLTDAAGNISNPTQVVSSDLNETDANTTADLHRLEIDCLYNSSGLRTAFNLDSSTIQGVEIQP